MGLQVDLIGHIRTPYEWGRQDQASADIPSSFPSGTLLHYSMISFKFTHIYPTPERRGIYYALSFLLLFLLFAFYQWLRPKDF